MPITTAADDWFCEFREMRLDIKYQALHARIQKVLLEGIQLWHRFVFLGLWGEGGFKYHYKRAIIRPPAKLHLNG